MCSPDLPCDLWPIARGFLFSIGISLRNFILGRREFRFFRRLSRMVCSLNPIVVTWF